MIVSEVPGTTRDSVDSLLQWHKRTFRIVDTAGIRRPGQVAKSQVESVSVLLAKRAIERADVVVLVLDATVGPTDQDGAIAGAAKEAGRGIIIAANKWDLMKDQGPDASKVFDEKVRYHLKFLDYAPILHISAATGERTPKLLEVVDRVAVAARMRVSTGELNRFIEKITTQSPPVTGGNRNVRVMYASQASVAPPTFVLFTNTVAKLHFSYERFLENRLRETYGFFGNPIRIQVRGRKNVQKDRRTGIRARAGAAEAGKKGPGVKANASLASKGGACQIRRTQREVGATRRQGRAPRREALEAVKWGRWRHPNASSSRPRKSAKSCRCSRTCCGRGKRSFRKSARPRPAADRACIVASTSSSCCASSSWSSMRA